MTEIPALPDVCWPVDTSCCAAFEDYDADIQDRAIALATTTLRALTLNRVGGCSVTVRPCTTGCDTFGGVALWAGWGSFVPLNWNGTWTNCGCSSACIHNAIELKTPVGAIDDIKIDGTSLPVGSWRLLDGKYLVRADGQPWPTAQDLTKADTEVGTWSITYLNAYPVDALGAYAAGILACEYAKACSGSDCALPPGVVAVARAGITMQITPGAFPDGYTGIREVDSYVRQFNPYGAKAPSAVWVPGKHKAVTWQ